MADINMVVSVVQAVEIQDGVRTMLLSGLPLTTSKTGAPQGYQKQFLDLAGSVLQEVQGRAAGDLAGLEATLEQAEAAFKGLQATKLEAAQTMEQATETTAVAKAEAASVSKVAEAAGATHAKAEKDASALTKSWDEVKQERARCGAVAEGSFRMLMDGGWGDDETMAEAVAAVKELLTEIGAEKVLVAGAPDALAIMPDARHAFDKIIVDEVSSCLTKHLTALDTRIAASAPKEARKKAEVLGVWAIADCAKDDVTSAKRKFDEAKATQKEAGALLDFEKQRVAEEKAAIGEQATKRARVQATVEDVKGAITAIDRLSTEPAEVPVTEPAAAEPEAAVETAAPAEEATVAPVA